MTTTAERVPAPQSIADLHERLGRMLVDATGTIPRPETNARRQWHPGETHLRGLEVETRVRELSHSTRAELANWRAETPLARQAMLEAEWQAGVRESQAAEVERIRVKYGRSSPQFRRAAIRLALSS